MRDQLIGIFGGTAAAVGGRRRWIGLTLLLLVLGAVEVGTVAVLGHAFLPTSAALVLDALGLITVLACGAAAASVLVRRHRIVVDEVHLVLGVLGVARVPFSDVVAVAHLPALAPVEEASTGPAFVDKALVLTAATGLPRLRLVLGRPVEVRRLWQRRDVSEIVVSFEPNRRPMDPLANPRES